MVCYRKVKKKKKNYVQICYQFCVNVLQVYVQHILYSFSDKNNFEKMSNLLWFLEIRQSSRLLRFYHLLMVWDIDVKTNQNTLCDPNIADMVSPLIFLTNYLLIKRYIPRYLTFRTAVSHVPRQRRYWYYIKRTRGGYIS